MKLHDTKTFIKKKIELLFLSFKLKVIFVVLQVGFNIQCVSLIYKSATPPFSRGSIIMTLI
jgi:hypothetical protein